MDKWSTDKAGAMHVALSLNQISGDKTKRTDRGIFVNAKPFHIPLVPVIRLALVLRARPRSPDIF